MSPNNETQKPEEQQLDQATRERILQADLANVIKKVKSGRPLSQSERDLVESSVERTTGDADELPLPAVVKKRRGGRPIKFTPLTLRRILRCARRGMPLKLCAEANGVTGMGLILHRRKHPDFELKLQAAIAQGADRRLALIEKASEKGTWAASAWMLEHCLPQHFARNRIEVTGMDGPLAQVAVLVWPHQQNEKSLVTTDHRLTETSRDAD